LGSAILVGGDEYNVALPFFPELGGDVLADEIQTLHLDAVSRGYGDLDEKDIRLRAYNGIKGCENLGNRSPVEW